MEPEPQEVIRYLLELMGGQKAAWRAFDEDYRYVIELWNQGTSVIERILRSHLFVEHFLNQYLSVRNPELGSLDAAGLTLHQKVALVGDPAVGLAYLLPGVRHLDTIRNRLAQSLRADVTPDDARVLLNIEFFREMRTVASRPNTPSQDPIDVLEDFAKHAGLAFHGSAMGNSRLWAEVIRRATKKKS